MTKRPLHVLALVGLLGCLGADEPTGLQRVNREGRPVLFVGNSLTYFNDLPLIVEALADSVPGLTPDQRLDIAMVAFPDYALIDHWSEGTAIKALESSKWNVVVLQQGSSALEDSRALLRDWTRKFDEKIRAAGGRTALYAVWPLSNRQFDFDRVNESYTLAAQDVGGMLFPVGEAWRAAWRRDPNLVLYAADGLHPTVRASYLAGLVMTSMLLDKSPVGMPAQLRLRGGSTISFPQAEATLLQQAAEEAIARFGKR